MPASALYRKVLQIASLIKAIEQDQIAVSVGTDFVEYRKVRQSQDYRTSIYPMFDVGKSYIDASNGFWIMAKDSSKEIIHTQAIRLFDMSDVTLGDHLCSHRHKYITPDSTTDPDNTYFSRPQALKTITGRVCYHGEFWLKSGSDGLAGAGYTSLLSRLVFEFAVLTWDPDFVFGFVPSHLAEKGIHTRYGYYHCEPGHWRSPTAGTTSDESLVWMSRADLADLLDHTVEGSL